MIHKFYKTQEGNWYIDLPSYLEIPGTDVGDLQEGTSFMVMGADTLLDFVSQGDTEVTCKIETEMFEHATYKLFKNEEDNKENEEGLKLTGGCFYTAENLQFGIKWSVWLCDVTKFVFTDEEGTPIFPNEIYFK